MSITQHPKKGMPPIEVLWKVTQTKNKKSPKQRNSTAVHLPNNDSSYNKEEGTCPLDNNSHEEHNPIHKAMEMDTTTSSSMTGPEDTLIATQMK